MAVCQNLVPLVNIKIAGKWMFIPLKMVLIGIDPSPYDEVCVFFGNLSSRMTTHGERLTGASKGDGSHRTPTIPGDKTDHC